MWSAAITDLILGLQPEVTLTLQPDNTFLSNMIYGYTLLQMLTLVLMAEKVSEIGAPSIL